MATADDRMPAWVERANRLLGDRPSMTVVDDWPRPPRVGDIRLAEYGERDGPRPRLVCVIGVDRVSGSAQVTLVSCELEMASPGDVVVPASESGIPFGMVVETRVTGSLWWIQIGRVVARLGDLWISRVLENVAGFHMRTGATPRPTGDSPEEALRSFRWAEARRLEALAADCEASLARGGPGVPVAVDPRLLKWRGEPMSSLQRLLEVSRALEGAGQVAIPQRGTIELLDRCCASCGVPTDVVAALRPLIEGALCDPSVAGPGEPVELEPRRTLSGVDPGPGLAALLAGLAAEHRSIRLVTDRTLWSAEPTEPAAPVAVRRRTGTAMQVLLRYLEEGP